MFTASKSMNGVSAAQMVPELFRVQRVRQETSETFTLELKPPIGRGTFPFKAGQFNMLYVFGVGEVPISISGDPAHPEILIHTMRAVGTVTRALQRLKVGDVVGVRGPFGTAWPVEAAKGYDVVLVVGGIGLPPVRSVLYEVLAHRDDYGRVMMLYGSRSPSDLLYRKELEVWRSRLDLDIYVTVDYADAKWRGNVGVVTKLIDRAPFDPPQTMAMMVGPEVMMRFATPELLKRGVPADNIYLSMERNMKCAIGLCGHCQFGAKFICKDGPVFRYPEVRHLLAQWEV